MRLVVDTNVLISAALKNESVPASVVRSIERQHVLLKSLLTEQQLVALLARPHLARLVAPSSAQWMMSLMAKAQLVDITSRVTLCRDPTDDKFLELAIDGRADAIVSGDGDLLALHPFGEIRTIPPAMFPRDLPIAYPVMGYAGSATV